MRRSKHLSFSRSICSWHTPAPNRQCSLKTTTAHWRSSARHRTKKHYISIRAHYRVLESSSTASTWFWALATLFVGLSVSHRAARVTWEARVEPLQKTENKGMEPQPRHACPGPEAETLKPITEPRLLGCLLGPRGLQQVHGDTLRTTSLVRTRGGAVGRNFQNGGRVPTAAKCSQPSAPAPSSSAKAPDTCCSKKLRRSSQPQFLQLCERPGKRSHTPKRLKCTANFTPTPLVKFRRSSSREGREGAERLIFPTSALGELKKMKKNKPYSTLATLRSRGHPGNERWHPKRPRCATARACQMPLGDPK